MGASATAGSPSDLLDADGHRNERADDDLLPVRRDADQDQAAEYRRRDERAEHGARHASAAAEQAGAADDRGGNSGQFLAMPRGRRAGAQAEVAEQARDAGEEPGQQVDL